MGSAQFVESLLSFVITHYISFFTNCPISTLELNRIIKPGASQPELSLGCELPVAARPAFEGGSCHAPPTPGGLEQALHPAREVGLFSLNSRE